MIVPSVCHSDYTKYGRSNGRSTQDAAVRVRDVASPHRPLQQAAHPTPPFSAALYRLSPQKKHSYRVYRNSLTKAKGQRLQTYCKYKKRPPLPPLYSTPPTHGSQQQVTLAYYDVGTDDGRLSRGAGKAEDGLAGGPRRVSSRVLDSLGDSTTVARNTSTLA